MIYKNIEIYNAAQLVETQNGVSWLRFPPQVDEGFELNMGKEMNRGSTGVELRFIPVSDSVTIKLRSTEPPENKSVAVCHVYRGGLQGGWDDHEQNKYISGEVTEITIKKPQNMELLKDMTSHAKLPWNAELVRVIFDRGHYEIIDVIGECLPPKKEDTPQKTLLAYGSSITHGSNSIDASHAWASVVAHRLAYDLRNMGMAGSCAMEKETVDYIAKEGREGKWDIATLELGINVISWDESKIRQRVEYTINTVASQNPDKPVYVISPFYSDNDFKGSPQPQLWRKTIEEIVNKSGFSNVTYVNGLDLLGDMSLISADGVHPDIYGVMSIADGLSRVMKIIK